MIIVMQENDELKFNPNTGEPIEPSDYQTNELWDGRTIIHIGDCNVVVKNKLN